PCRGNIAHVWRHLRFLTERSIMRSHSLSVLIFLAVTAPGLADELASKTVRDQWDVAYLQGKRAGYVHTVVQEFEVKRRKLYKATVSLSLMVKRGKETVELRMESGDTATEQGRVLSIFVRQYPSPGKQLEITGVVDGRELRRTQDNTKALPPAVWDDGVIGLF